MLKNDKRYWIIEIPLNIISINYNTNYIECIILNMVLVELEVCWTNMDHHKVFLIIRISL